MIETAALLRAAVVNIAKCAGAVLRAHHAQPLEVFYKDDQSPVSEADLAADRLIRAELAALEPSLPVLSEETVAVAYAERRHWRTYWLVDPLDGTQEFIRHSDEFTVNIALVHDGLPILGVIYAPIRDYLAHAVAGGGACVARQNEARRVFAPEKAHEPIRMAWSKNSREGDLAALVQKLGRPVRIALGSSLKFCLIADGEADVYVRQGNTSEWDTAAGQCILEVAGGFVTDFDLRPLRYNQKESLINPSFIAFGDAKIPWRELLRGL